MSFFFNGRLYVTPAVMSVVDDAALLNTNLTVGNNLVLIGASTQGKPNTALQFSDPSSAVAALGSGDLADAVSRAFAPSPDTGGPATVTCVRVNPAVQASLALLDGASATIANITSRDYGQKTNQIKLKVEAGSLNGFKLTAQQGQNISTQDNVYRAAFSIQYTGAQASAQMTISNTTQKITLFAPIGTQVGLVDLTVYPTIQQVVDYINTLTGFTAAVLGGNGLLSALNGLDNVTAQDVKTAVYTATGTLQAVIDWINGQGDQFLLATRPATAGTLPALIPWTYLAGGSDGVVTNTQWANAFTLLQTVDVQWVVALSTDPSIAAMADAHCQFMSTVGRKERRNISGTPLGTTNAAAVAAALAINSDRTSLVCLGVYDYNAAGALTLYAPFITAAMMGGMFAGVNPGVALTNKSLSVRGVERQLIDPTDTDQLILAGVVPVLATNTGFKIVQSISTWLNDTRYDKVEVSVGAALDFVARNVRQAVAVLKGAPGNPDTLSQAVAITETALRQLAKPAPAGPGVLVGNAASPAYKNITASLVGNVLAISFQCSPVIPVNYIPITIYAVPFSGSVTVAS